MWLTCPLTIGMTFANGRSRDGSRSIPPTAPRSARRAERMLVSAVYIWRKFLTGISKSAQVLHSFLEYLLSLDLIIMQLCRFQG